MALFGNVAFGNTTPSPGRLYFLDGEESPPPAPMSATYTFANGTPISTTFINWAHMTQSDANVVIIQNAIATQANLTGNIDPTWDHWWKQFQTDPHISNVVISSGNV